jgi:Protein of unknown function (DUF2892)
MKANEGSLDRLIRICIGFTAMIGSFFWLGWTAQIIVYIVWLIALVTGCIGFCGLYKLLKITTCEKKKMNKKTMGRSIIAITLISAIFGIASSFFTKKIFLEDFATMNNNYKQLLFNSGKEKRAESISYYEKLIPAYNEFQEKYTNYQPLILRWDENFTYDIAKVGVMINNVKDGVYSGDLVATHKALEAIRPIFQDIFKRNGFSMTSIALIDFHDIMEVIIEWADNKDTNKIIETYPLADEKLKEVEWDLNDEWIQAIRKNLDTMLDMAKNNQLEWLEKQGADLKASFVKVYLIRG